MTKQANQLHPNKTVSVPASSTESPVSIAVDNTGIVIYVGIESGLDWARKPDYALDFNLNKSNTQIFQEKHSLFRSAAEKSRLNPSSTNLVLKMLAEQIYLESCGNLGVINEIFQSLSRLINSVSSDRDKLLKILLEVKKLIESNP